MEPPCTPRDRSRSPRPRDATLHTSPAHQHASPPEGCTDATRRRAVHLQHNLDEVIHVVLAHDRLRVAQPTAMTDAAHRPAHLDHQSSPTVTLTGQAADTADEAMRPVMDAFWEAYLSHTVARVSFANRFFYIVPGARTAPQGPATPVAYDSHLSIP